MSQKQPIIIKRVKKGGHGGGHGGAWKVAYADFVTAMMCFFLVMWLMGSDQETKAAISSYFNNPNPSSPWRPELKDNENIPLGNQTGAGESVLKGVEASEENVKDPVQVVQNDPKAKSDVTSALTEEAITSADTISYSIAEDEIFDGKDADKISRDRALKHLSIVGKIGTLFKGNLKIRGLIFTGTKDDYELRLARLIAVQQFIIDNRWMPEELIKTTFRKVSLDAEVDYTSTGRRLELVFTR